MCILRRITESMLLHCNPLEGSMLAVIVTGSVFSADLVGNFWTYQAPETLQSLCLVSPEIIDIFCYSELFT